MIGEQGFEIGDRNRGLIDGALQVAMRHVSVSGDQASETRRALALIRSAADGEELRPKATPKATGWPMRQACAAGFKSPAAPWPASARYSVRHSESERMPSPCRITKEKIVLCAISSSASSRGRLLPGQEIERRRCGDQAFDRLAEGLERGVTKGIRHAVIGADFLDRGFPAQPLAEIRPDRKARAQQRPVPRPVAATDIFEKAFRNGAGRVESDRRNRPAPAMRR